MICRFCKNESEPSRRFHERGDCVEGITPYYVKHGVHGAGYSYTVDVGNRGEIFVDIDENGDIFGVEVLGK